MYLSHLWWPVTFGAGLAEEPINLSDSKLHFARRIVEITNHSEDCHECARQSGEKVHRAARPCFRKSRRSYAVEAPPSHPTARRRIQVQIACVWLHPDAAVLLHSSPLTFSHAKCCLSTDTAAAQPLWLERPKLDEDCCQRMDSGYAHHRNCGHHGVTAWKRSRLGRRL